MCQWHEYDKPWGIITKLSAIVRLWNILWDNCIVNFLSAQMLEPMMVFISERWNYSEILSVHEC